jgi:hypothetical protein
VTLQTTTGKPFLDSLINAMAAINESMQAIPKTGRRDSLMSMMASQKLMIEKRPIITVMMDRERLTRATQSTTKRLKSRENVYPL